MNEDLAEYVLELASQSTVYADVRLEKRERNEIIFKNGALDTVTHISDEGIGVRILTEEGIGFSSTNVLDKKSAEKAVNQALKHARACKRTAHFSDEESVEDTWSAPEKYKLSEISIQEKLEDLLVVEDMLPSLGEFPMRLFTIADTQTTNLFLNSEGSHIHGYTPVVGGDYSLIAKEGATMMQIGSIFGNTGGWECFKEFNIVEDVKKRVKNAKEFMKKGKKLPKRKMDVVIGPAVVGIACHESSGHPSEADRILGREASQAGTSFMNKDMLGTKIGSDITVVDDPTLTKSYAYYLYDDEGVKSRKRFLIKNGYINEFLQCRESAAVMHTPSNAAARSAHYNREPLVRMANTYMLPGEYKTEELIEDITFGVYMREFKVATIDDIRYNLKLVGDQSLLIEHGEITHPVKEPVLEITTPGFYSSIDACGKDLTIYANECGKGDPVQVMPVTYGGPCVRLRNISVR
jgi:TldD protein